MGFEIEKAVKDSRCLRKCSSVLESGLVAKTLRWWTGRWEHTETGGGARMVKTKEKNEVEGAVPE